jgi:hypothetical protein
MQVIGVLIKFWLFSKVIPKLGKLETYILFMVDYRLSLLYLQTIIGSTVVHCNINISYKFV